MDDFAVFVNDYLTPDQLSIQEYSCASDQQEFSLLVTIDDYEMMCRWHTVWTFSSIHRIFFQSVVDLDNSFTIDAESLTMKVYCLVDGSFNERGKHFSYLFEDKSVRSEGWVLDLEMLKKKHL